jgi:hypothetical protein
LELDLKLTFKHKIGIGFITFAVIISVLYSVITFYVNKNDIISSSLNKSFEKFKEREKTLNDFLYNYRYIIQALREDVSFLREINNCDYKGTSEQFSTILKSNKYMQEISFIDSDLYKLVHVKKVNQKIDIDSFEKIKNIAHEDYIKQALQLKENQVLYSNIQFSNQSKVDNSIIYLLTPVYINKVKIGILKITIDLDDTLTQLAKTTLYNIYLVNKDGKFILHKNNCFDIRNSNIKGHTIKEHYPNNYKEILDRNFYLGKNFYSHKINFDNNDNIKMILEIKDDIVTIHLKDVISRLLVVFIIVIILSLPFIYILSNIFEKIRLKLENQIKLEIDKNTQKDKLLLHNSRLAIMGEMLAMIAHQWKQPLASQKAILNAIEIRRRLNTLDEEYLVKSLSKFNNLSTFLSNTIDDFRNFFKKDKDKSLVNIKKIIENSIDLVSDLYIKNNIKIDIKEEK